MKVWCHSMTEQWKEIEGFPFYLISSEGRIWSKTRIIWKNIEEDENVRLQRKV